MTRFSVTAVSSSWVRNYRLYDVETMPCTVYDIMGSHTNTIFYENGSHAHSCQVEVNITLDTLINKGFDDHDGITLTYKSSRILSTHGITKIKFMLQVSMTIILQTCLNHFRTSNSILLSPTFLHCDLEDHPIGPVFAETSPVVRDDPHQHGVLRTDR